MAFSVSLSLIDQVEQELAYTFPKTFRNRLARSNGGELFVKSELWPAGDNWSLYSVRDGSDRKRLSRSMTNIIDETADARKWPSFPASGIAIGANGTGDRIIFLPDSEKVWTWDHETGEVFPSDVHWG